MNDALPLQLRYPLLQGRQEIAAIWLPHPRYNESTRQRLIIQQWQRGATAWRFSDGDLLIYAQAISLLCEEISGWPLCLRGKTLCSASLNNTEAARLPAADIWLIDGASVRALYRVDGQLLAPSSWLDLSEYALLETLDNAQTLPQAELVLQNTNREIRAILGDKIPPTSPERAAFLRGLQARQAQSGSMLSDRASALAYSAVTGVGSIKGQVVRLLYVLSFMALLALLIAAFSSLGQFSVLHVLLILWFVYLFRRMMGSEVVVKHPASTPLQQATAQLKARNQPASPQRWRERLARLAIATQLSKLLGRAQAAYMRKMLDMFENGQLDEALRHAIPLGGQGQSVGPAFGLPQARNNFQLSTHVGASASIGLGDELESYLRQLYRRSFEQLDRAGRIEEAVFVLAELLNAKQEALDYLEKHQRFQQAAELALGWDCSPDTIVRLHCLAGDWRTAILVAKRDRAFANAVLQLEKKWPDAATQLRLAWAENLIQQGHWLQAVDALWPVAKQRQRAIEWLQQAEQAHGQLSMQALVKRALLLPDTIDVYGDALTQLGRDLTQHTRRHALACALLAVERQQHNTQSKALARIILPAILADQSQGVGWLGKAELQNLLNLAGDKLLLADLPAEKLPAYKPAALKDRQTTLQLTAPASGTQAIHDAVMLNDGNVLLALGEAGAVVVNAYGKILFRLAVPADKLVISYSRTTALALAQRQQMWRVTRLNLVQRSAHDLGICQFDFCADSFDGIAWTICQQHAMRVLDTSVSLQHILWQANELLGRITAFVSNEYFEQFILEDDKTGKTHWQYQLPQRRLIKREAMMFSDTQAIALHPAGGIMQFTHTPSSEHQCALLSYQLNNQTKRSLAQPNHMTLSAISFDSDWLCVQLQAASGETTLKLHYLNNGANQLQLNWPATQGLKQRFDQDHWLCFDGQGRLFTIALYSGVVLATSV